MEEGGQGAGCRELGAKRPVGVGRKLLAKTVRILSPLAGVTAHHRLLGRALVCPVYHLSRHTTPVWWNGRYSIKSPIQFEKDLDLLFQLGNPVSLDDLLAWKTGRTSRPRGWFLSFDDGYREMADVIAPILKRKGIPATFFLCSSLIDNKQPFFEDVAGWIAVKFSEATPATQAEVLSQLKETGLTLAQLLQDRVPRWEVLRPVANLLSIDLQRWLADEQPYLTGRQVAALLNEGFHVGAHSVDHPLFSAITPAEQLQQITLSVGQLRQSFPTVSSVFAFPYGEFGLSGSDLGALQESGEITMCFGTRGIVSDEMEPFLVQRMLCEGHATSFQTHVKNEMSIQLQRLCSGRGTVRRAHFNT